MANRVKKEEKKRGKPFPSRPLSERDFNELLNSYDENRKPVFKDVKTESNSEEDTKKK